MTTTAEADGWRVVRSGEGTLTHGWFAVAPGCPADRHPTRDCACRVWRTEADAVVYVAEREAIAEREADR